MIDIEAIKKKLETGIDMKDIPSTVDSLIQEVERLKRDRREALNVKTEEGLTAKEHYEAMGGE